MAPGYSSVVHALVLETGECVGAAGLVAEEGYAAGCSHPELQLREI